MERHSHCIRSEFLKRSDHYQRHPYSDCRTPYVIHIQKQKEENPMVLRLDDLHFIHSNEPIYSFSLFSFVIIFHHIKDHDYPFSILSLYFLHFFLWLVISFPFLQMIYPIGELWTKTIHKFRCISMTNKINNHTEWNVYGLLSTLSIIDCHHVIANDRIDNFEFNYLLLGIQHSVTLFIVHRSVHSTSSLAKQ